MTKAPKGLKQDELLAAALDGLELQKKRIEAQIAEVRAMLRKRSPGAGASVQTVAETASTQNSKRRELSPQARLRIAAAQKKRWAEYRRKKRKTSSKG